MTKSAASWVHRTFLAAAALCAFTSTTQVNRALAQLPFGAEPAVQISSNQLQRETYSQLEGWVRFSYIIEKDGSVGHLLIEDSHGSRSKRRWLSRWVSNLEYRPATWIGLPVEQAMRPEASSDVDRGVTARFINEYQSIQARIRGGDLEGAEADLRRLHRPSRSLHEFTLISLLHADLEFARNRPDEAAFHLGRVAGMLGSRFLEPSQHYAVLGSLFSAQASAGMPGDALQTYSAIRAHPLYRPGPIDTAALRLREVIASSDNLSARAVIQDRAGRPEPFWDFELVRRSFAFSELDGTFDRFELRCNLKHVADEVVDGRRWQLLDAWGGCRLYVFGEPGSSFRLLLYAE